MSEQAASPAVEAARADLRAAIVAAGERIVANLSGATEANRAEAWRLLDEAKFRGIVLNELLLQEGNSA